MSKKSVPNPDSYFWNQHWYKQEQNDFLKYVHSRSGYRDVRWLYKFGRDLDCLWMTLEEFQTNLKGWCYPYRPENESEEQWRSKQKRKWRHKNRNNLSWYNDHGIYREKQKFQKNRSLIHNVVNNKKEWREMKGFERDYRKHKKGSGWKTCFKRTNARVHRRRESQNIFRENWDFTPYKRIEDLWGWD